MRSKRDCSTRQEFGLDRHDVIPGTSLRSRRGGSSSDETYQLWVMDTASGSPAAGRRLTFGTENCLGTGCYGASDPTAGATLAGLAPNVVTDATNSYGIAADDFQFPVFGQPFLVTLNGGSDPSLTTKLESLNESGPVGHFFTIGLDPALDNPSHNSWSGDHIGDDSGAFGDRDERYGTWCHFYRLVVQAPPDRLAPSVRSANRLVVELTAISRVRGSPRRGFPPLTRALSCFGRPSAG